MFSAMLVEKWWKTGGKVVDNWWRKIRQSLNPCIQTI